MTSKDIFNAEYYSEKYSDLAAAFGTDTAALYDHYVSFGQTEGRVFSELIDVKKYREAYKDLDEAFGDDWDAYVNHFVEFGYKEGRESFGTFNAKAYAERYSDLKDAFGDDLLALYNHYITFGISEGRDATYHASSSSSSGSNATPSSSTGRTEAPVTTVGRLLDPKTGAPVPNATLTSTRTSDVFEELAETVSGNDAAETVSGGDILEHRDGYYVVRTDADGYYEIPDFAPGVYRVEAEAEGFLSLTLNSITIEPQASDFAMPTFQMLSEGDGSNTVSGVAKDAVTGAPMSGVTVTVRADWNTYEGSAVTTVTTAEDGSYTLELARGYYTLEFSIDGYSSAFVNVASSNVNPNAQGVLVPSTTAVGEVEYRIVLTWGETPNDLDSHLVGPSAENGLFHVYYADKQYFEGDELVAQLDVDDVSSYGPETVTIVEAKADETYYYSVHDFTNGGLDNSTEMSASGAIVKVYLGAELVKEYNVPLYRQGNIWNVFKIENGEVVTINEYNANYDTIFGEYTLH